MRSFAIFMSMLFITAIFGCNSEDGELTKITNVDLKESKEIAKKDEEDHEHKAPHGGDLVELGDHEYSAEFVVNHDEHKLTIYVYDAHAENAVAIEQKEIVLSAVIYDKETEFKVPAVASGDDKDAKASQFELADEELVDYLEEEDAEADFSLTINGKEYSGEFGHHHHEDGEGHHKHKKGDKDDDEKHEKDHKDKDDGDGHDDKKKESSESDSKEKKDE